MLRYLKGKLDYGILFPFGKKQGLEAYADSDYASCPITRKSTSGNIVFYNGAPISWVSAMQSIVALSSCEAEFNALVKGNGGTRPQNHGRAVRAGARTHIARGRLGSTRPVRPPRSGSSETS